MPQFVVLGEALIDVFAEKGVPLRAAKTLHPAPGGAPANVAVALARLGADIGFIGKVGVDDYGRYLIDLLADEGVDTTHFIADPGGPTMMGVVAVVSETEQQFILYNGANALLTIDDLSQQFITAADVFIYGSVTFASASRSAALQAARWAKAAGKHVIFDVNLRTLLWPDLDVARQYIEDGLETATVVKVNDTELEFLTGQTDPAVGSAQLLEQSGVQLCCVSLGEDGAYFNNGIVEGAVPAFTVEVKDTTGSGDAFVAGLALKLARQPHPIADLDAVALTNIVRFANACGALAATAVGGMTAAPTVDAVNQLL